MKQRFPNIADMKDKRKGIIALLALTAIIIATGGMLVGCENIAPINTQNTLADSLYEYKNTYVGDNSKVVAIVDLLPNGELIKDKVELQTHDTPYGIGAYYKIDDRQIWRENSLQYETIDKRNAAIMFALIVNMDSLSIGIGDQYSSSDQNDRFVGSYTLLENLNEYFGTDYLTKENLEAAVASKENFRAFVDKVMSMEPAYKWERSDREKIINDIIGKGWEIVVNSGTGATFILELEKNLVAGGFDLEQAARANNVDITEYYGKEIYVCTYDCENYAGQEPETAYVFVFCGDELIAYKNLASSENATALGRYFYKIEISQM